MAFNYSPKVVVDGLVLYLDAANPRSYPGSGTTWSDLSRGGNNGTLTNGPTFSSANGGSIVFDGVNDYVISTISKSSFPTQITINVTFQLLTFSDIKGLLQFANTLNDTQPWILIRTFGTNTMSWYLNGDYRINHTILTNVIYSLDITYDGTIWRSYKNSILDGTYQGPVGPNNGNNFWIGNGYNGYTNIQIYNVRLYNRALTSQEVLQNYNATKSRFGLT